MKDDKPTSFDIAYRAGVSQSTVSRALRNSPLVNEETRLKVQQIARELNYKVDKNASSLDEVLVLLEQIKTAWDGIDPDPESTSTR